MSLFKVGSVTNIQVFYVFSLLFLFIGTLGASSEQTRAFAFNIAPFFVFLSPKMEVRLTLDSKKAISNFKKGYFELQKSLT